MAQPVPVPATSPSPDAETTLEHDDIILLEGGTWDDYLRLLAMRAERRMPRLAYLEGVIEIMSPSRAHEIRRSMIGRLVEAYCIETGIDITPYGAWTLKAKRSQRALEPDECYVLGDAPDPKRPDLALEVVWTSGGLDKLEIYRKIRVPEVWIWKAGKIRVYELGRDGYQPIARSQMLPGLEVELLERFVPMRPMTRALREYRAALGRQVRRQQRSRKRARRA
jgi:Uma2 family endonuclease